MYYSIRDVCPDASIEPDTLYTLSTIEDAIMSHFNDIHKDDCETYDISLCPGEALQTCVKDTMDRVRAMRPGTWFKLTYENRDLEGLVSKRKVMYQIERELEAAFPEVDVIEPALILTKYEALTEDQRRAYDRDDSSPYGYTAIQCHMLADKTDYHR